ncbi:MAG: gephyrin-like molybdotransferase Glp [Vicinamibacterales bacterium]
MRPIRETIPLEQALELLLRDLTPIARTERVPLDRANGRVLAAAVTSPVDVPPFDRAAMDGYAVIAADTFGASRSDPAVLRRVDTIFTGDTATRTLSPGECMEIATGAPIPPGADAVVMVEETETADDRVRVMTPVYPRQHIGRRAADIAAGQTILTAGQVLNPSRIGAIAAIGAADVEVFAQPTVAVISTGNEIVDPGQPLAPGQIHDINRFTLSAVIAEHGGIPVAMRTAADSLEALDAAITSAAQSDVLVFSGGSSVGTRDLVLDAIRQRGEVIFHGIAVKPGKPTAFGWIDGRPVLGMPGYPTSCLSNAYILLIPLLRTLAHLPVHQPRRLRLPLARRIVSTTGRHQFYTVRIDNGTAVPAFKASGDITSMSQADGYIEIPTHTDIVSEGDVVDVTLF